MEAPTNVEVVDTSTTTLTVQWNVSDHVISGHYSSIISSDIVNQIVVHTAIKTV